MTTLDELNAKLDRLFEKIADLERTVAAPPAELLTVDQAAATMSLCTKTVYRMVARGDLKKVPVGKGKRDYRIPLAEVRRFATPKTKAPQPRRAPSEPYNAKAEFEKTMRRLGGRSR